MKIREISEVRRGQGSKDFEKNPDLTRKLDPNCCFVIFYGNEFKLKTLSLGGKWLSKVQFEVLKSQLMC